jgi:hypothetical protein
MSIIKAGRVHEDDLTTPVGRTRANNVFHVLRTGLQPMANSHYIPSSSSVDKLEYQTTSGGKKVNRQNAYSAPSSSCLTHDPEKESDEW